MYKFKLWLYTNIKPFYTRLQNSVQSELNRIASAEALADGIRRWKEYRMRAATGQQTTPFLYNRLPKSPCMHLKGGRMVRSAVGDYAVYGHTFPDNTYRIKCMLCPKVWYPSDADWADAVKMVESSTNTWSSSEIAR